MRKAALGALLLAAVLVARPGLARSPPPLPPPATPVTAQVPAPAPAEAPPATPPEQPTEDPGPVTGEQPPAGEELPAEEAPLPEEDLALEEEEMRELGPSGYADATGNLETLETTDGLRVSVRDRALRAEQGYTPLEIILHNTDATPRPVKLSFRGYGAGAAVTTRTLELAPRQRLATYLLLPSVVQSGALTVESPNLRSRNSNVYLDDPNATSTLVLGTSKAFEAGTGVPRSDENRASQVHARFLNTQDAPREVGAYVGYDVVLVAEDAASVPADVWAALDGYAALGGSLILARPPRDVAQRLPLLSQGPGATEWNRYGFGQVLLCQRVADCGAKLTQTSEDNHPPLHAVGAPEQWERNRMALRGGESPLLPNAMAPVGRFLVLIFLFTLVVGPGGLVLARRKGPAALLIGVPSVALLTCLIIVADSVLGDGFVTHASRYSFTFLDRPRDRAITSAVSGFYANLSSGKVQMPANGVLLAPDELEDWDVDVDWTSGGMVADGFLPARTYAEWAELAVVPTRARLVVRREDGVVWVQNALGAPLERGYLQLGSKRYALPELADGREGSATEVPETLRKAETESLMLLPVGMRRRTKDLQDFTQPMRDREFLAQLGGDGFAPLSSLKVQLHEGAHFVRGQVDGP